MPALAVTACGGSEEFGEPLPGVKPADGEGSADGGFGGTDADADADPVATVVDDGDAGVELDAPGELAEPDAESSDGETEDGDDAADGRDDDADGAGEEVGDDADGAGEDDGVDATDGSADALPTCSPEHEVDLCEDGDGDGDVENPAGVTVISNTLVRGDVRLRGGRLVVNSARTLTVQGAVEVGATSTLDVRGTLTSGACSVAAGATILGSFVCP